MKDTAELFASLDALKARLDAHCPLPPDVVSQIREDMRVRFTYHSNAIEGNTLTMSETKAVLEDGITIGGKSLREHLEAVGHIHAIDYLEALVQRDEALTERTLKEIHNLILRNIDRANAGTYRRMNVLISGAGHIPPPAERVPEKMESFFQWYGAARGELHPVEFAARVHADFVNIHPFKDGNGRTARLIMNLELMRAGFPASSASCTRSKNSSSLWYFLSALIIFFVLSMRRSSTSMSERISSRSIVSMSRAGSMEPST